MKNIQAFLSEKQPLTYLIPFVVYMAMTSMEPEASDFSYPWVYSLKILLTLASLFFVFPTLKQFLRAPSFWGLGAGILGAIVWISLCQMDKKSLPDFFPKAGLEQFLPTSRPGYNPFAHSESVSTPTPAKETVKSNNTNLTVKKSNPWFFFTIRLIGLAIIVPIIEEFFLRGLILRFVCVPGGGKKEQGEAAPEDAPPMTDWYDIPIGTLCPMVWAVSVLYPLATHPEALAGIVWFCGITLLAWKTKSLSDCISAHAITNLALGLWVLYSGQWNLL